MLASHGFDPSIALATYCYLDESRSRRAPIRPEDLLESDLGLSPEETEHTLLALMALLGRKPALDGQRQHVRTVEDLIRVLQTAPAQETQRAGVAA